MLLFKTFGRYLTQRFFRAILSVFGTFFFLILTLDFVELMRRAGDSPVATTPSIIQLALYRAPSVAEQIFPFAVLFGGMFALLNLSRKLELVVARSVGISAWQFLQPAALVAGLIGLISIGIYNPVAAELKQRATKLEASLFARTGQVASGKEIWIRQRSVDGQAIIRAAAALEDGVGLAQVAFFNYAPDGGFSERIEARQAVLHHGYWELSDARVTSVMEEPQSYTTYLVATNLEPEQVRQSFTPPDSVGFWSMPTVIERTRKAGLDTTRYELRYESLKARPLLLIAMILVAASVSLRFFRFGGVTKLVVGGVAAGFMLYVATQLSEELGSSGIINAPVAAWLPAIVGSLLGALALLHQEDG
ncbi:MULTISPECIES: LPS export ABC transporter permease LptG [Bosea]|jgi:lipopolysaccharide export system permease protein|uniref:LPS export ABC transporter permease LptG n=1 Tax=Bosea rubneri TaxID=3075434 RepID=A0ABU3S3F3_9HYPH|nr:MULTISPECIES: LPS export ABC transporter permease LptG [unclassified Bosea (in: a-proteobacteria)]MDU0339301.1 LPS export ABC transporter permease LptG [Bosea sp. ZW T0_25]HEV7335777.1 LPS export ABC transporter permease LptG [Bosea sp. (in: a-proteobacteria)]